MSHIQTNRRRGLLVTALALAAVAGCQTAPANDAQAIKDTGPFAKVALTFDG